MTGIDAVKSLQIAGADANNDANEARPQITRHLTRGTSSNSDSDSDRDNLVPSRTPASRKRRSKRRKGKNKHHFLSTITYSRHYSINMEDNIAELGVLAKVGHDFCPYAAVARFPYKYIDKAHLQPVSEVHFAGGQFRARGWTL